MSNQVVMNTSDDIDDIKKELEEVRRLKESLKEELEELRKENTDKEGRPRCREHAHPREPYVVDLRGVTEGSR